MSSLEGVLNCYVFAIIFAVFLHDLASFYPISSKRNHSRLSYGVISISKISDIAAMELEVYTRLWF